MRPVVLSNKKKSQKTKNQKTKKAPTTTTKKTKNPTRTPNYVIVHFNFLQKEIAEKDCGEGR